MSLGVAAAERSLDDVPVGSHVCWVADDRTYIEVAGRFLRQAEEHGEKPVAFGPEGSAALAALRPLATTVADPRVAFLGGGPLDPDTMFDMFRVQSALARREGHRGIRLVADMDWLLPAAPATDDIVAFELLLDRQGRDVDATIVCAYRATSFDRDVIMGACHVHRGDIGALEPPQFRMVAAGHATWELTGEVDIAVDAHFVTAVEAVTTESACTIDISALDFIDVRGLSTIANASRTTPIRLVGASQLIRNVWELTGLGDDAPNVTILS